MDFVLPSVCVEDQGSVLSFQGQHQDRKSYHFLFDSFPIPFNIGFYFFSYVPLAGNEICLLNWNVIGNCDSGMRTFEFGFQEEDNILFT